jgi:formylmethanofuran dehydrogenase subunit E
MGKLALAHLGVEHEKDHGLFVFPELGEGHPQTCMMDGMQAATGATYGKLLMAKTGFGKLAATFYCPGKGAVRLALKSDFPDALGRLEFFAYRRRGVEPSQIPAAVANEVIQWTYAQPDDFIFAIQPRPDFAYTPVKVSFNKTKCSFCNEYVFDRYVRIKNGQPVCIPCSEYET